MGGHNLPLLVEVGLTDLPKSGGPPLPPPGSTSPDHYMLGTLLVFDKFLDELSFFLLAPICSIIIDFYWQMKEDLFK